MIVDPKKSFKWLRHSHLKNIQQSGIDIRLKTLSLIPSQKPLLYINDCWHLEPGHYDFTCYEYVDVPSHCCALIIQRSSLNRKGTYITTGLYDNGFHNYIGGVLHVGVPLTLEKGERIAQIIFIKSESRKLYKGKYNG